MEMRILFASDDEKVLTQEIQTIEDLVQLQNFFGAPLVFDMQGYFDEKSDQYLPALTVYDDYME